MELSSLFPSCHLTCPIVIPTRSSSLFITDSVKNSRYTLYIVAFLIKEIIVIQSEKFVVSILMLICFIHWLICLVHQHLSYGQLSCAMCWTNRKRCSCWKLRVPILWNSKGWIPLSEWRCSPGRILCHFSSSQLGCFYVSFFQKLICTSILLLYAEVWEEACWIESSYWTDVWCGKFLFMVMSNTQQSLMSQFRNIGFSNADTLYIYKIDNMSWMDTILK